ncbi:MAG: GldG family protein [Gammaproteobacteria bacterium]|nr:GldG family protein [Gammaproteobacteria bacterium]
MKSRATIATVGTRAFALVILVGVNLLSSTLVRSARIDLTENGLYTLSGGTRGVLESLDDPVTLRLFLSREMSTRLPGINAYATRVRELLEEFARIGGDDVRLEIIDPEPFSEAEDRAVASGLEGVPVGDGDALFYFGSVASGPTGEQEVIPFFSMARGEFLEYDLTRMIHRVANPELPVVGLLSALPMDGSPGAGGLMGGMPRPWAMYRQLEQFFEIRTVEPGAGRIDDDVDVLVVVHPAQLDERTLYAVDQFVLGGGNALVFVDGYAEGDPTSRLQGPGYAGNDALRPAARRPGPALRTQSVAADIALATRVRARANERNVLVDYPVWLNLRPGLYDDGDVVTGQLGDVVMASPGVLDLVEREGVEVTP